MLRLGFILLCASLAAVAVTAGANAATTQTFQAVFKEDYLKSGPRPCSDNVSPGCFGGGQIVGFGKATESFEFGGSSEEPEGPCSTTFGDTTITLADGSGSFVSHEVYVDCNPGNSHEAPGHLVSYGNPILSTATWEIVEESGTGIFEGASGGGTLGFVFAGASLVLTYEGTITLA